MSGLRYWRQAWRCRREWGASAPSWRQFWDWQRRWMASFAPGHSSLADERPWITFGAEEFLESRLTSSSQVFEWGSGGSSLFFARRAGRVISVEHDPEWFARVQSETERRQLTNWQGFLEQPEASADALGAVPADCDGYVSDAAEYRGCHFRSYASRVDSYADHSFDIMLIDGRARPSCLKHALRKLKVGGCLVWDNSERDYYALAMQRIPANFKRYDFPGPGPYVTGFWRTTIWVAGGTALRQAA